MFGKGGSWGGSCFPSGACLNGALAKCLSGRCWRRRGSGIFLWDSPSRPSSKFLQEHVSRMNPAPSLHTCKRPEPSIFLSTQRNQRGAKKKAHFPKAFPPISSIFGFPAHTNLRRPGLEYEAPLIPHLRSFPN